MKTFTTTKAAIEAAPNLGAGEAISVDGRAMRIEKVHGINVVRTIHNAFPATAKVDDGRAYRSINARNHNAVSIAEGV